MASLKVYNLEGKATGELELNPSIFNVDVNSELIHQIVVAQMANKRLPLAHTKTRGEVRGGGKKPWKQKGTGRARHGSIRSPLWKGGGVTFGPTKDRNFSKKVNKKMKKKALFMALSGMVVDNGVVLVEELKMESIKTKAFLESLQKLNLSGEKVLVVLPESDVNLFLSARNLENVNIVLADSLNVVDVLKYNRLLMPVAAVAVIEKTYLKS